MSDMKCVSLCARIFFFFISEIVFAVANIQRVTLERRAEKHVGLRVKWPLLLTDCNQNWKCFDKAQWNSRISNFIKIRSAAIELLQTDRQAGERAGRQADGQTNRQTGRQTGRQTSRQTGRQTDRRADRQAGRHVTQYARCQQTRMY